MKCTPKHYAQALHTALENIHEEEFSIRVKSFLNILKKRRAFRLLPQILREVGKLENGAYASIEGAKAASPHIIAVLQDALGVERIEQKIMPELLGGMMVEWNDWRVDGSVQGKLRQLEQRR